ncbi:MAG: ankyrin repeat domain-containing protein [Bdellovibrionales bacterium]
MAFFSRILLVPLLTFAVGCARHKSESYGTLNAGKVFSGGKEELREAVESGNLKDLQKYLDEGADINARLNNGRTMLIHATVQSQLRVIQFLVKKGADASIKDGAGKTALQYAIDNGNLRAQLLLDSEKQKTVRKTLMSFVVKGRYAKVLESLEDGADPNFTDPDNAGETPLTLSIQKGKGIVIRTLVNWKDKIELTTTDLNLPNEKGEKPLSLAKAKNLPDIVELLTQLGAKE